MPRLDIPQNLYQALSDIAEKNKRTPTKELISILEKELLLVLPHIVGGSITAGVEEKS